MTDLKIAFRQLLKNPGFTVVAVATLALGIMAATAMYSVVYAVLLDPFPYRDVDHLMSVRITGADPRNGRTGYSTDQFVEIAERNTIFEGTIASTISDVTWTGAGDPQRLRGNIGTFNTFQVMGVPPLLGRVYGPADSAPGAPPVVVLGYKFWQRQFGGEAQVIGHQLRLNDKVRTVIGVMPKRFMWRGADVYLPVVFERGRTAGHRFNLALFSVFGILGLTLAVIGIYGVMSNTVAQQTHEIGLRMAIGATPGTVAKMVLHRGTGLLLVGLAIGLVGSVLSTRLMANLVWRVSPFDLVSFMAVSLILLLTGLLACAWPAWRAARIHPMEALRYE